MDALRSAAARKDKALADAALAINGGLIVTGLAPGTQITVSYDDGAGTGRPETFTVPADHSKVAEHYTALATEANEVVAYRFPSDQTDEMCCVDSECSMRYADLLATCATPMTLADVEEWQNNRDGKIASCASCGVSLDGVTG